MTPLDDILKAIKNIIQYNTIKKKNTRYLYMNILRSVEAASLTKTINSIEDINGIKYIKDGSYKIIKEEYNKIIKECSNNTTNNTIMDNNTILNNNTVGNTILNNNTVVDNNTIMDNNTTNNTILNNDNNTVDNNTILNTTVNISILDNNTALLDTTYNIHYIDDINIEDILDDDIVDDYNILDENVFINTNIIGSNNINGNNIGNNLLENNTVGSNLLENNNNVGSNLLENDNICINKKTINKKNYCINKDEDMSESSLLILSDRLSSCLDPVLKRNGDDGRNGDDSSSLMIISEIDDKVDDSKMAFTDMAWEQSPGRNEIEPEMRGASTTKKVLERVGVSTIKKTWEQLPMELDPSSTNTLPVHPPSTNSSTRHPFSTNSSTRHPSSTNCLPAQLPTDTRSSSTPARRSYIPAYRSSAYAILKVLSEFDGAHKQLIAFKAAPFTDAEFNATLRFSAFSAFKTLINRNLIYKESKNKYYLTDEGRVLCNKMFGNIVGGGKSESKEQNKDEQVGASTGNQPEQVGASMSHLPSPPKWATAPISVSQTSPSESPVTIIIDSREKRCHKDRSYFQTFFSSRNIPYSTRFLGLGDFIWISNEVVLNYIIERKAGSDFVSSISDGRYSEQKRRLLLMNSGGLERRNENSIHERREYSLNTQVGTGSQVSTGSQVDMGTGSQAKIHPTIQESPLTHTSTTHHAGSTPVFNIFYIIENLKYSDTDFKPLVQYCLLETKMDKLVVLETDNIQETGEVILEIDRRVKGSSIHSDSHMVTPIESHAATTTTTAPLNMPATVGVMSYGSFIDDSGKQCSQYSILLTALLSIRGLNNSRAYELANKYNSIGAFMNNIENICTEVVGGKPIGKGLGSIIKELFK